MIDELMPWPAPARTAWRMPIRSAPTRATWPFRAIISGYIRFIDTRRLVALAKRYHVSIRVLRRVGHFVPAGIPLDDGLKGQPPVL